MRISFGLCAAFWLSAALAAASETSGPIVPAGRPLDLDAVFDGAAARPGGPRASDIDESVEVVNGQLQHYSMDYKPWGLALEGGNLGLDSDRDSMMGVSPWISVRKGIDSRPDSPVDYRVRAQLGAAQYSATYFGGSSAPDPAVENTLSQLAQYAALHGSSPQQIQQYLSYAQIQDPYQTDTLVVGSVLAQIGRAMELYGPVDIGATATSLVKMSYFFPNAAVDAAAGPRVRMGEAGTLAVYGGATENLSPISADILSQALSGGTPGYGAMLETAPHAGFDYRARLPTAREAAVGVAADRQWNRFTTADQVRCGIWSALMGKPVGVSFILRDEHGPAVEYDDRSLRSEVTARFTPTLEGSLGVSREAVRFGDASVTNDSAYAGLKLLFGPGGARSLKSTGQRGGKDALSTSPISDDGLDQALSAAGQALSQAATVADAAAELLKSLQSPNNGASTQQSLSDLSASVQALPPSTKQQFESLLLETSGTPAQTTFVKDLFGGAPSSVLSTDLGQVQATSPLPTQAQSFDPGPYQAQIQQIQQLLKTVSDPGTLQALAIQLGQAQMASVFNRFSTQMPVIHAQLRLDPAVLLAAGQIFNSGPSPMLPFTRANEQDGLEPLVWKSLGTALGLPPNADQQAVTQALAAQLSAGLKDTLAAQIETQLAASPIASQPPQQAAATLVAQLPPNVQASLQAQYGQNLSGLIPPGATTQQVIAAIVNAATTQEVQTQMAGLVGQGVNGLTQWIGDVVRHELNQYMLQLFLTSRELDRITVDHGVKANEFSSQMLSNSFSMLDRRESRRPQASPALDPQP